MRLLFESTAQAVELRVSLGLLGAGCIALLGMRSQALTRSGALATIAVGTLGFAFGGAPIAAALILFFASGSVLSRITRAASQRARSHAQKQGRRDALQVFANGAVATACAVIAGALALFWHGSLPWLAAAIGALAAASGDTWSTELGSLFGGTPRSIVSGKAVEAGTSGGVTPLGFVAALAGGALVGLAGTLAGGITATRWVGLAAAAGLAGSALDSIAGATLQGLWRCPRCGRLVEGAVHEGCQVRANLVRGWGWLDNDGVNLIATVGGALLAAVLART